MAYYYWSFLWKSYWCSLFPFTNLTNESSYEKGEIQLRHFFSQILWQTVIWDKQNNMIGIYVNKFAVGVKWRWSWKDNDCECLLKHCYQLRFRGWRYKILICLYWYKPLFMTYLNEFNIWISKILGMMYIRVEFDYPKSLHFPFFTFLPCRKSTRF